MMSNILLPTQSDGPVGIEMHRSRPAQGIGRTNTNGLMFTAVMSHETSSNKRGWSKHQEWS
jgi:hypothetical protein